MPMGGCGEVYTGFDKLQSKEFEHYMQTYSTSLGRNSKKSLVDLDLSSLDDGMNNSCIHARIFYDFPLRRFTLEVIGKNGCLVEVILYLPENPHVKLDSQDLLQIGDKKFYFLLPIQSLFAAASVHRHHHSLPALPSSFSRKGRGRLDSNGSEAYDEYEEDEDMDVPPAIGGPSGHLVMVGKKVRRAAGEVEGYGGYGVPPAMSVKAGPSGQLCEFFEFLQEGWFSPCKQTLLTPK